MRGQKEKKKLCWNCEGNVTVSEENCPYCGVYLGPALSGREEDAPKSPYTANFAYEEDNIPPSPFASQTVPEAPVAPTVSTVNTTLAQPSPIELTRDGRETILSMGLLSLGSVLLLFSMVLFFFSDDGVFTLKWNGDLWYVYVLIGFALLGIGWRSLQKVHET